MTKKGKNLFVWKHHLTMTKKKRIKATDSTSHVIVSDYPLLSTTSVFSSPMVYNTTASLDNLNCTDYMDSGKRHDRFGQFSWSKNDANYLVVRVEVFKRDNNRLSPGPKSHNVRSRCQQSH